MEHTRRILSLAAMAALIPVFSGCTTYMTFKHGMTQPGEESPATLVAFLEKEHFPAGNQYLFFDSASFNRAISTPWFRKNLLSHMIFDRSGILLQRDTTKCQWSGFDRIRSLSPDSAYEKCNGPGLDQILRDIQPFGPGPDRDDATQIHDFTLIVTWAKFLGTYNARLFVLQDAVKQNKTARIRLIWLNVDMQKSWSLSDGQKMKIR